MLAGAGRLDGRALMRIELVDPDAPEHVAERPWQGIGQVRVDGRFRRDMLEMDNLPARRVPAAQFIYEPIDLQDRWRQGKSPCWTRLCSLHCPQAPWIKILVPSAISRGHIYSSYLSRHGKACQHQNPVVLEQ